MTSYIYDMVDTWNAGATTFTAVKMNVTDTASASGSLLMDLQVGGSSRFNVGKTGSLKLGVNPTGTNQAGTNVTIAGSQGTGTGAGGSIVFQVAPAGLSGPNQNALVDALTIASDLNSTFLGGIRLNGSNKKVYVSDGNVLSFGGNTFTFFAVDTASGNSVVHKDYAISFGSTGVSTPDVFLRRDTTNTLALRNGGTSGTPAPQTFRVYNWTDGTNSEFGKIAWSSNVLQIGTEKAGTGAARTMVLQTDGTTRVTLNNSAVIEFTYSQFNLGGGARIHAIGNGVLGISNSSNADGSFVFGVTASNTKSRLTPSGTTLQVRLGDDSAFASIQGKLTTETAYTAGDPTTTGYLVVYDSTGTAYKIPAVAV